ncbi:uncharacterized protein LOC144607157 isoform X3 [Rhinoraja longicauda]
MIWDIITLVFTKLAARKIFGIHEEGRTWILKALHHSMLSSCPYLLWLWTISESGVTGQGRQMVCVMVLELMQPQVV